MDAVDKNLVKMSKYGGPVEQHPINHDAADPRATGLQEAALILARQARKIPLDSVTKLAEEWDQQDLYQQLVRQKMTRFQMISAMTAKLFESTRRITMIQFVESLEVANMKNNVVRELKTNLQNSAKEGETEAFHYIPCDEQIARHLADQGQHEANDYSREIPHQQLETYTKDLSLVQLIRDQGEEQALC